MLVVGWSRSTTFMSELKLTWGRVLRLWFVLLCWIIGIFIALLLAFAGIFVLAHLVLSWGSSSPESAERSIGTRFGLLFGVLLYVSTLLGSVLALKLALGRRIADFRVILVSAAPSPNRVAGRVLPLPAPTPPYMRVRVRRFLAVLAE